MKIRDLRPMIWTEDFDGTIKFYNEALGFTVNARSDEWGWASLSLDGTGVMVAKPNEHIGYSKIGFTGTFYFNTDGVDAWWEKLKDKVEICYGIDNFEHGMREFCIYDNNGYMLQFGEEISG